jgi:hypothetical protein
VLPVSPASHFLPSRSPVYEAEKGSLGSYPQCLTVVKRTLSAIRGRDDSVLGSSG